MIWLAAVASNDVIGNVYGSYMIGSAVLLMLGNIDVVASICC